MQHKVDALIRAFDLDSYSDYPLEKPDSGSESLPILRHTGGQISWDQFAAFYKQGSVFGAFRNNPLGPQFRDRELHFYWHDLATVEIVVFTQDNGTSTSLNIHTPNPQRMHPTLDDIWLKYFKNSGVPEAHSEGKCEEEQLVFMLNSGFTNCVENDIYRSKYDNDTTMILFTSVPGGKPTRKSSNMQVMNRFELWARPFSAWNGAHNGFSFKLRYPDTPGISFEDFLANKKFESNS